MTKSISVREMVADLGPEIIFAFLVTILCINVFLWVRIKFGEKGVTHMTTWPYKMAFVFLTLSIL